MFCQKKKKIETEIPNHWIHHFILEFLRCETTGLILRRWANLRPRQRWWVTFHPVVKLHPLPFLLNSCSLFCLGPDGALEVGLGRSKHLLSSTLLKPGWAQKLPAEFVKMLSPGPRAPAPESLIEWVRNAAQRSEFLPSSREMLELLFHWPQFRQLCSRPALLRLQYPFQSLLVLLKLRVLCNWCGVRLRAAFLTHPGSGPRWGWGCQLEEKDQGHRIQLDFQPLSEFSCTQTPAPGQEEALFVGEKPCLHATSGSPVFCS